MNGLLLVARVAELVAAAVAGMKLSAWWQGRKR